MSSPTRCGSCNVVLVPVIKAIDFEISVCAALNDAALLCKASPIPSDPIA